MKRALLVSSLYKDLLENFEHIRSNVLKFDTPRLRALDITVLKYTLSSSAHGTSVIKHWNPIENVIKIRWTKRFMLKHRIFLWSQTVKLMVKREKQVQIEK